MIDQSESFDGFDGSHFTVEEGTLFALGLNPDSVNILPEDISNHLRKEGSRGELERKNNSRIDKIHKG